MHEESPVAPGKMRIGKNHGRTVIFSGVPSQSHSVASHSAVPRFYLVTRDAMRLLGIFQGATGDSSCMTAPRFVLECPAEHGAFLHECATYSCSLFPRIRLACRPAIDSRIAQGYTL